MLSKIVRVLNSNLDVKRSDDATHLFTQEPQALEWAQDSGHRSIVQASIVPNKSYIFKELSLLYTKHCILAAVLFLTPVTLLHALHIFCEVIYTLEMVSYGSPKEFSRVVCTLHDF